MVDSTILIGKNVNVNYVLIMLLNMNFIFYCCSAYRDIRKKHCNQSNWPSLVKFKNLLSCQNVKVINNVARFVSDAMKLREEKLQTLAAFLVSIS